MRALLVLALAALTVGCHSTKNMEDTASESSPQHDQLKELEWLIGDWVDQDENVDVTYSYKWDYQGHFITGRFVTKGKDQKELDGEQVITWDPSEKRFRSWIFDSDGGFGTSNWSKEGDTWYATTSYTLSDGQKASALHVYTKLDDKSYSFSSEERDVGGTLLPNIGPFKVVRK